MRYLIIFLFLFSVPAKANFITFNQCISANEALRDDNYADKFKKISDVKWSEDLWIRQNYSFRYRQKLGEFDKSKHPVRGSLVNKEWEKELIGKGYEKIKIYEKHAYSINLQSNIVTQLILYTDEYVEIVNNNLASFDRFSAAKFPTIKSNFKKFKITSYADGIILAQEIDADVTLKPFKLLISLNNKTIYVDNKSIFYKKNYVCKSNNSSEGGSGNSSGTAFFVNNRGNLVTNHHVIEGCKELNISYFDKEYETKVLHSDKNLDLAVLKADVRPKDHISVSKNPPKKLQNIFAAGYPLGKGLSDDLKITSGIISSIKGFKDNVNEIQIDAAINSGNSGGPIISEDGYLVGVSVAGLDKSKTESVNFGIKASSLEQFLNVNEIKYSKPFYEFSSSKDSLRKLLENSTVYISCKN